MWINAGAVRDAAAEVSPHAPVDNFRPWLCRGCEFLAVGFGDDQRRVVRGDGHAIREGEAMGKLASRAIPRILRYYENTGVV
jgi:hypothetical protein